MFKPLSSEANFAANEKETIKYWENLNIVEKLKEARQGRPKKVYYDGPITANNMPHYGHAITWTMKDIVPRYWSMKNYFVSRNMGWDCQGIPVEVEVEKELGFEHKSEIEKFGVAKFNDLCRQSVFKYRDSIFEYEKRLGRWFDEKDMYYTMDASFIESMWWSLKELYTKGLLYEGHKVVAYSTRAGTPLSTHEVNEGGYKEVEDPSVTLKFELNDQPGTYVLAWTTTPWTLPGNLLLAVGSKIDYVLVESEGAKYILAASRVEDTFAGKKYKHLKKLSAEDLVGKTYKPLFPYFAEKSDEGLFKIVSAVHATDEDGTGIVHLAPYGAEDFEILMGMGAKLFDYLDDTAHFTSLVPEYEGLFYKAANKKIIEDLTTKELLFKEETILHRVGLCWRTGTPLIYKPMKSWYVAVTKIKDRMLEENQKVNWLPEHLKNGTSAQWLSGARDWALSRSRYWGTPIPIWVNDKTGERVVIGSFAELEEYSGVKIEDPHRPFVDEITWDGSKGGVFKRIEDVADVWYDSGSVPFAKLHYPFENKDKLSEMMPADYISEGLDQVRLWFYTMHVLGVALFDEVPYKNVVTTGMLLAKNGEKLSKSKKNFPPMDEVLEKFGGDILRMFILTSPIVQSEPARFYEEALLDVKKEFFLPLWNSVNYFLTYAELNSFKPAAGEISSENPLDKWILSRYQETVNIVTDKMDQYKFLEASRQLTPFVSDLSTWYIRRSRDRLRSGDLEALKTLYYVLCGFTKLIAPMTPFVAEHFYEALGLREKNMGSVHLDFYPVSRKLEDDEVSMIENMTNDRNVVSKVLAQRVEYKVPVRQPLSHFETTIKVTFEDIVKDEVNVKEIKYVEDLDGDLDVHLNTEISEELEIEGLAREITRKIQGLRKTSGLQVSDKVKVVYESNSKADLAIERFGDEIKVNVGAVEIVPGNEYSITKEN